MLVADMAESADTLDLDLAVDRAMASRPELRIDRSSFEAWLRERVPIDADPRDKLVHVDDLLLAYGCLMGDGTALAVFERELMPAAIGAIAKTSVADIDEVAQHLREKLLVGSGARLATYRGAAPLKNWLRVCATREALMNLRDRPSSAVVDQTASSIVDALGVDPELDMVKRSAREAFRRAFACALRELPDRERNVLRYHVLDGLTGDEIARIYGKSPSSISRWLTKARVQLLEATHDALQRELPELDRQRCASLVRLISSRLDVTLSGLMKPDESG